MDAALRTAVRRRARLRCEYCLLPEARAPVAPFQVEHIVARQHGGPTILSNLALACHHCDLHKGPNLTGRDPATGKITRLYHPRRHKWAYHFRFDGSLLIGRTAIGRTTIDVLQMNHPQLVALREILMAGGIF